MPFSLTLRLEPLPHHPPCPVHDPVARRRITPPSGSDSPSFRLTPRIRFSSFHINSPILRPSRRWEETPITPVNSPIVQDRISGRTTPLGPVETAQAVAKSVSEGLDDPELVDDIDGLFGGGGTPDAPLPNSPEWEQEAPDSRKLARNLGIEPGSGLDAHHIVPGEKARGAEARELLNKYHIPINGKENGVALIGGKGAPQDALPRHHRGGDLHSNDGIDALTARLNEAIDGIDDWSTARAKLIEELETIADEIREGEFP